MSAADVAAAPTSFVPASTFGATHPPARLLRSPVLLRCMRVVRRNQFRRFACPSPSGTFLAFESWCWVASMSSLGIVSRACETRTMLSRPASSLNKCPGLSGVRVPLGF